MWLFFPFNTSSCSTQFSVQYHSCSTLFSLQFLTWKMHFNSSCSFMESLVNQRLSLPVETQESWTDSYEKQFCWTNSYECQITGKKFLIYFPAQASFGWTQLRWTLDNRWDQCLLCHMKPMNQYSKSHYQSRVFLPYCTLTISSQEVFSAYISELK